MSSIDPTRLLRAGLLEGVSLLLAHPPPPGRGGGASATSEDAPATAIAAACQELGAAVRLLELAGGPAGAPPGGDEETGEVERAALAALAEDPAVDVLALDAAGVFARAAACGPPAALAACMQATWELTRAVAGRSFIAPARPGRILLIAPPDRGGEAEVERFARAARAGLENLARTLSIEWSRHSVTTVAIAPGAVTEASELAALCAYLASPAGAYFSGCLLDLTGPSPASRASERAR